MTLRNGLRKISRVTCPGRGGVVKTELQRGMMHTTPTPGKREKPGGEGEGCEATVLPNYFPSLLLAPFLD